MKDTFGKPNEQLFPKQGSLSATLKKDIIKKKLEDGDTYRL